LSSTDVSSFGKSRIILNYMTIDHIIDPEILECQPVSSRARTTDKTARGVDTRHRGVPALLNMRCRFTPFH
jgi:hypothetical protein